MFELKKQIKTTAIADAALGRIVMNLRASPLVRWKGGRATQEAVYNAVWMWLEEIDPAVLEEAMSRHVPRLEALMRGEEPDAAAEPGQRETVPGRAPAPGPTARGDSGPGEESGAVPRKEKRKSR